MNRYIILNRTNSSNNTAFALAFSVALTIYQAVILTGGRQFADTFNGNNNNYNATCMHAFSVPLVISAMLTINAYLTAITTAATV